MACVAAVDAGLTYSTATVSAYVAGRSLTVTIRSKGMPLSKPRLDHRTLPRGNAPPVVSVARKGIMALTPPAGLPVCVPPWASVHCMATAGLVICEKSMVTALGRLHGAIGRGGNDGGGDGGGGDGRGGCGGG